MASTWFENPMNRGRKQSHEKRGKEPSNIKVLEPSLHRIQ